MKGHTFDWIPKRNGAQLSLSKKWKRMALRNRDAEAQSVYRVVQGGQEGR